MNKKFFFFSIVVHALLISFFFVRFSHYQRHRNLIPNDVIDVTVVDDRNIDFDEDDVSVNNNKLVNNKDTLIESKPVLPSLTVDNVPSNTKRSVDQSLILLRKNILQERNQELMELKKEQQKHKGFTKVKEEKYQKILKQQIALEQKQFAISSSSKTYGDKSYEEINTYKLRIKRAIDSQWIKPERNNNGDFCELLINIDSNGMVLEIRLVSSSGNLALNRSAEAAVWKASPLPVPNDPKLFVAFKTINPIFKPEGIIGN
ncbi:MAG: cell envelope integrity protein TolA [Coxiellaceae bacterium]|nr:cell envelope integrity protein TolA [Coxiellaceae bacterium]